MYNLSITDVREFFFCVYEKSKRIEELNDIEKIAYSVILEHPEFNYILVNRKKYAEYEWTTNSAMENPFLHLSLHLTLLEQLTIDQPYGIKDLYQRFCTKFTNEHNATHELLDCLVEMIWQSQKTNQVPDVSIYLDCAWRKLNK